MAQRQSVEFRRDAVRIAHTSGLTMRQVASDLGIGFSTLGKWVRAVADEAKVPEQDAELLRENERLRKENRILKDWSGNMAFKYKNLPRPTGRWHSRVKRSMTALVLILATVLVVGVGFLFAISPGRPAPLRDASGDVIPGSLSERVTVEIGGISQSMIIQSVDPANPVLLFLHGGPGMPEFFMEQDYPTGLERHFTMVWWEQRGAGMSYSADIRPETMTMAQMISDTIEVADYLRERFGQDRILLLGHSWGSYLGIQVAAQAPDRFLAYVGMAQIVHQIRSEVMAHDYLLGAYRARGDAAMVRRLEAAPVSMEDGLSPAWMRLRDAAMHGAGVGHTRDINSVITGIFLPVWRVRAYTMADKINVWRGKLWSRPFFWEDMLRDDLSTRLTKFQLPIYFFVGQYDQTANPTLSRAYFDVIEAPVKGFYVFENSAHSPLFEEPERAMRILLQDVLPGTNVLADAAGQASRRFGNDE